MAIKNEPTKADLEFDPLAEKIRDAIRGVEGLGAENRRLTDQIKSLETAKLQLESEVECLNLTLEQERSERRHYHSLANEIITRLDVVGQTINGVVKKAEEEAYRKRRETPRPELPDIKGPGFLEKVEARMSGNGEKPKAVA
jgi:predicted RNase H-like nuclease (RuvC/YqgF family)